MAENRPDPARPPDSLVREALLYAAGELDAPAAADFERRLGGDALAREALADAVQLSLVLEGRPLRPDPAYRSVVRDRCARRREPRARYFLRYAGFGLVAALLLAAAPTVTPPAEPAASPAEEHAAAPLPLNDAVVAHLKHPAAEEPWADAGTGEDHDMLGTARDWAELSATGEHLQRTWDEEARRKARHHARVRVGFEPSWEGALTPHGEPE